MLSENYIRSSNILNAKVGEVKKAAANSAELEQTKRDVAPAMIMCISFSIELLLKCLRVVDKEEIRTKQDLVAEGITWRGREGHDFLCLFDAIAQPHQEIVRKHLAKYDPSVRDIESVRLFLRRIGTKPFIVWRYVFELDSIPALDQKAFMGFGGSLRSAVIEIRSALREAKGKSSS